MPKETVKLISAEGFEYIVAYEAACVSNTIKNMLSSQGSFTETELGEVKFPEITAPILEKVCQYFYYKLQYQNSTSASIPEFKVISSKSSCVSVGNCPETYPMPTGGDATSRTRKKLS